MPTAVYPNTNTIRVTFYQHERPFSTFLDAATRANAYVQYAQLCKYGITIEVV